MNKNAYATPCSWQTAPSREPKRAAYAAIGLTLMALTGNGCTIDASHALPEAAQDPTKPEQTANTSEKLIGGGDSVGIVAVNLQTGGDDKRGDSKVWITVTLRNGNSVTQEANDRGDWPNWTWSGFTNVYLPSSTRGEDIANIVVTWQQGGGGWNGDNWNLQGVDVYALDNSTNEWSHQTAPPGPLQRFTGSTKSCTIRWYL